jgi:hypothetical protein
MAAVLMDSAAPGQICPTAAERWDLVRGGLRARFGALGSRPVARAWLDVVAAAVVVLPVVLLVREAVAWLSLAAAGLLPVLAAEGPGGGRLIFARLVGWAAVSWSLLTRRDRGAGWWSAGTSVVVVGVSVYQVVTRAPAPMWAHDLAVLAPSVVLLAALSAGLSSRSLPARGRALLGRPLVAVAGAALAATSDAGIEIIARLRSGGLASAWTVFAALIAFVAVCGVLATAIVAVRRGGAAVAAVTAVTALVLVEPLGFALALEDHRAIAAWTLVRIGAVVIVPLATAFLCTLPTRRSATG